MATGTHAKKASDYIPYCDDQGMEYLAGAAAAGLTVQAKQITQSGVAPLVVDLVAAGMVAMADANYVVIAQGETAGQPMVDQSTITPAGFNVLGGADTEVIHVVVIGTAINQLNE